MPYPKVKIKDSAKRSTNRGGSGGGSGAGGADEGGDGAVVMVDGPSLADDCVNLIKRLLCGDRNNISDLLLGSLTHFTGKLVDLCGASGFHYGVSPPASSPPNAGPTAGPNAGRADTGFVGDSLVPQVDVTVLGDTLRAAGMLMIGSDEASLILESSNEVSVMLHAHILVTRAVRPGERLRRVKVFGGLVRLFKWFI
jgi:hypothetical protein